MPTELLYLFLASILLAVMWIAYIIVQVRHFGLLQPEEYVTLRDVSAAPNLVSRAGRARVNLVEQFGAFAGLVVVGELVDEPYRRGNHGKPRRRPGVQRRC